MYHHCNHYKNHYLVLPLNHFVFLAHSPSISPPTFPPFSPAANPLIHPCNRLDNRVINRIVNPHPTHQDSHLAFLRGNLPSNLQLAPLFRPLLPLAALLKIWSPLHSHPQALLHASPPDNRQDNLTHCRQIDQLLCRPCSRPNNQ